METTEGVDHEAIRRRRRMRWLLPAFVAAAMLGTTVYFLIPRSPLDWTKRNEWRAEPVYKTDLKRSFLGGWRNLPFDISATEEAHVKRCVELLRLNHALVNAIPRFADPAVRSELESILQQHPDFFYAEYALALWHRVHGSAEDADQYLALAYRHAPIVLVQTYQHEDGTPLANTAVGSIEIECNRVRNGSLDPSLHLFFPKQVTDDRGRIYLPVYDTVYRISSISHPDGYILYLPPMGWFESDDVGLLPAAVVRTAGDVEE